MAAPCSRRTTALAVAGLLALGIASAAPAVRAEGLGPLAPMLEGTWELEVLRLPGGRELRPPLAEGTIVVDGRTYLAAAYVLAGPDRKVGSLWQGDLDVELAGGDDAAGSFVMQPRAGFQYDSEAQPPARPSVPPAARGSVVVEDDAIVFQRQDGGVTRWLRGEARRVQQDPDGTVIEHVRTSLVPRVPEDLPGRSADDSRADAPAPAGGRR